MTGLANVILLMKGFLKAVREGFCSDVSMMGLSTEGIELLTGVLRCSSTLADDEVDYKD